jgi:hypothetical protein
MVYTGTKLEDFSDSEVLVTKHVSLEEFYSHLEDSQPLGVFTYSLMG